jgi:hypothetical protein
MSSYKNKALFGAGLSAVAAVSVAGSAHAQAAIASLNYDTTGYDLYSTRTGNFAQDRNVSVLSRPRPGYDPVPYRIGTFVVSPSLTAEMDYDSNLLASNKVKESSGVATLTPAFIARSDWSRNYFQLLGNAQIERHTSYSQENRTMWQIAPQGRVDVDQSFSFQAGGSAQRRVEPRTATTAPITDRPIKYDEDNAFVGATKDFNRLRLVGFGTFQNLNYQNNTQNGVFSDQNYRNRQTVAFNGQAEYTFSPGYELLLTTIIDDRNSTHGTPTQPERDSKGVDVQAGTLFDIGGIASGTATVGYYSRNYSGSFYKDFSGVTFAAGIQYYATPLMTIRFNAVRSVEDSTVTNSSGYLTSAVNLHADYEYARNVVFTVGGGYDHNQFKGIDREDNRFNADALARWILNRAIEVGAKYNYQNQTSKGVNEGRTFNDHRIGLYLTYRGTL